MVSLLFIFNGSAMILTEYYKIRGHPVYPWVPYLRSGLGSSDH
ncbi:protein of unknown function [Pseudodesulfovibrio profundus]|uniref:Uncharacterized protein n=1 Tax=Pseudodesulfovibrio profundus TaxID=57320 RepID=A0A2C8F8S8_9BACT|nr:protein of unknown function [Pseudodesulfovibrio profundus]